MTFCVLVDVDYNDEDGGDYWTDNTGTNHGEARGFRFRVQQDNGVTSPPTNIWEGWLEEEDSNSYGCTPELTLDSTEKYDLFSWSKAKIDNATVYSYDDDDPAKQNLATATYQDYSPTQDETFVPTPLPGQTDNRWNVLASVAFALTRHNGLGSSGDLWLLQDYCCQSQGDTNLHVSNKRKFNHAHELGHWLNKKVDDGTSTLSLDYSYADGVPGKCNGVDDTGSPAHGFITMEYQSAAAIEGIADWYAAITWNNKAQSDCEW